MGTCRSLALFVVVVAAAGCNDARFDDVTAGIYSLEITEMAGNCEPERATGRFQSAIVVGADSMTLYVPEGTVIPSFEPLEVARDLEYRRTTQLSECESGERRRRLVISATDEEQVLATLTDVFAGLADCPSDSFAVPERSCQSDRLLRFRRRQPCSADNGCRIEVGDGFNEFSCICE